MLLCDASNCNTPPLVPTPEQSATSVVPTCARDCKLHTYIHAAATHMYYEYNKVNICNCLPIDFSNFFGWVVIFKIFIHSIINTFNASKRYILFRCKFSTLARHSNLQRTSRELRIFKFVMEQRLIALMFLAKTLLLAVWLFIITAERDWRCNRWRCYYNPYVQ